MAAWPWPEQLERSSCHLLRWGNCGRSKSGGRSGLSVWIQPQVRTVSLGPFFRPPGAFSLEPPTLEFSLDCERSSLGQSCVTGQIPLPQIHSYLISTPQPSLNALVPRDSSILKMFFKQIHSFFYHLMVYKTFFLSSST